MYEQPEPFIDFSFYNRAGETEVSVMGIGESGQLYVLGYGGWSNLGNKTKLILWMVGQYQLTYKGEL